MHLFSGAGGGILADLLLGHQPICAADALAPTPVNIRTLILALSLSAILWAMIGALVAIAL